MITVLKNCVLLDGTENMIPKPDTDAVITREEIFSFFED